MITGFFYGQTYGLFFLVFPHGSSTRRGVTGESIINIYDHYDFVGIWVVFIRGQGAAGCDSQDPAPTRGRREYF